MITSANVGVELFEARRKRKLSLRDVRAQTGISIATLSRTERGKPPTIQHFEQIASWIADADLCLLVPDECCVVLT